MSVLTLDPAPRRAGRHERADVLGEGVARARATSARSADFRADVQGLRALAIVLVVLYHCGVSLVSGGYVGVDVFFVISGFLITSHLVREVETDGRVRLLSFYARRIRRLLPAALLVIAVTVVVARVWGPLLAIEDTARDGLFSAFYSMNYHLAELGTDYQQANAAPSPLQHYWSLAVEEQFYLVWPILVLAVAATTRRWAARWRRALLVLLVLAIVAASLAASIATTATNGPLAYYALHTRGWELGIGALVALAAPLLRRTPAAVAGPLTWVGLGAVVVAALGYDGSTSFPGYLALLPVLGTALVVAGGCASPAGGVMPMLSNRPTQLIGTVSYSWYLWHWPALVLGPAVFATTFDVADKLAISGLALWLAVLTHLLLELPTQRRRLDPRRWMLRGLGMSLGTTAVVVAALTFAPDVQGEGADVARAEVADLKSLRSGLRAGLAEDQVPIDLDPSLRVADADVPMTSGSGCHVILLDTGQPPCVFGDTSADRTILLFGDSHAEQWFTGLERYAEGQGWRLISWTKVACPVADVTIDNEQLERPYTECDDWRQLRLAEIAELAPDVVVTSQADSLVPASFDDDEWANATRTALRTLADLTPHLIFLGDTPRADFDVPECLAADLDDMRSCDVPSDLGLRADGGDYAYLPGRRAAVRSAIQAVDVTYVDTQEWTCIRSKCPPVVGTTLVYRDDSHLTQSYVRAIEPVLAGAIDAALQGNVTRETTP